MTKKQAKEMAKYWKKSAERSWRASLSLFESKHYDVCLFFCHLAIEKLIKAMVVERTGKLAPFIHDLEKLAHLAKISLTNETTNTLREITNFNVAGRYEDAKYSFYKKCTKSYTEKYYKICQEIFLWLEKEYKKN